MIRRLVIFLAMLVATFLAAVAASGQTVTLQNNADSWVAGFETNCNINPCPVPETITIPIDSSGNFTVHAQHDLVVFFVWCRDSCTVSSISVNSSPVVSISSGDIVQTSVQGAQNDTFGQASIYYIADAPSYLVGSKTLSLTVTGGVPPSGQSQVQYQIAYADFSVTAGYHFVHHLDSAYVTGTGATVNAPAITAPGDLIINFEDPDGHTNNVNSPWTGMVWLPDYFQGTTNSSNGVGYIASGPAGSVTPNISVQYGIPSWGSMITTFTPTATSSANCPSSVTATTCYFVSAQAGASDSNTGADETHPWLHAPGMPNCSGTCASVAGSWGGAGGSAAGIGVIFRGGDTWHEGNSTLSPYTGGTWNWQWSGSSSTCVYEGTQTGCSYIGVDKNWYNSATCGTSWCRPVLSGDNPPASAYVPSCAYQAGSGNTLLILSGSQNTYDYFDSFEMTGFCAQNVAPPAFNNSYIVDEGTGVSGKGMNFLNNLYLHGWTVSSAVQSGSAVPCALIGGSANGLLSITKIVIDGSDSLPGGCAWAQNASFYHFNDSIVRYATDGGGQWCHDIHDNILEHWYPPIGAGSWDTSHPNTLACSADSTGNAPNQPANTPNVFYNNIFRHDDGSQGSVGPTHLGLCPTAIPEFWFNNLMYDLAGGNYWNYSGPPNSSACPNTGGQFMFNNTLVDVVQPCYVSSTSQGGKYLNVNNEHLINTPFDSGTTACTGSGSASNVAMSDITATSQGYTTGAGGTAGGTNTCANDSTTPCAPSALSNSTVGTGTNNQAYCTTLAGYTSEKAIGTDAANACKLATTDACSYNLTTHTMNCPAQAGAARPQSGVWDSGAYQLGTGVQIQPPTGVQAIAH